MSGILTRSVGADVVDELESLSPAQQTDAVAALGIETSTGGQGVSDAGKFAIFKSKGGLELSGFSGSDMGLNVICKEASAFCIELSTSFNNCVALSHHLGGNNSVTLSIDGTGGATGAVGLYAWMDGAVWVAGDSGASDYLSAWGDGSLRWHPNGSHVSSQCYELAGDTATPSAKRRYLLKDHGDSGNANVVAVITKGTTGDPASGYEGQMVINTFDNTLKCWAEGAWRQLVTW